MYSIKIKLDVVLGYKGMTLKELSEKNRSNYIKSFQYKE